MSTLLSLRRRFGLVFLSAAALAAFAAETAAPAAAPALRTLDFSGNQAALAALDRDLAAAGSDATKLAAVTERLVRDLRATDLTFAARQAIGERLGLVLGLSDPLPKNHPALAVLAKLLAHERDSDPARLALERAPGPAVDDAFVAALASATGRTRLGLIQSLGVRRAASAVSALAPLLTDADAPTAAAAAAALGQIGTTAALTALRSAPDQTKPFIVAAKLAAAHQLPAAEALPLLAELEADARLPLASRAAALRGLLAAEPAPAASGRLLAVLAGDEWAYKQVAVEAIASLPAATLAPALAARLASFDAPTQTAVIAALGRQRTAAAGPTITAATAHASAEVRSAALIALGFLPGTPDIAATLARVVATGTGDEVKLARQSLARLNGPGLDAAILAGAERGEAPTRIAYLEQIALRNLTEGLPLLLKCRADPEAGVRSAAVGALGDFAPFAQQAALIEWTVGATDPAEQARALRAVVNVTLRHPDAGVRAKPVLDAIERAAPEACVRLVPLLPRLGGSAAAECAARLALRPDAAVADAALAALGRWTDNTALPALATVAEKSTAPAARRTALDAVLRNLERNREPWSAELTEVIVRLLAVAPDAETRQHLVVLLNRAADPRALEVATKLAADPAVAALAEEAVLCITANLAGRPTARASGNPGALRSVLDGRTNTRWSVPADPDQWIEIDFKAPRPLHRLTLDQTGRLDEFPVGYEVFVTDDPAQPGAVRQAGTGQRSRTVITLPAGVRGRYLLIKHTGRREEGAWTISELHVD